MRKIKYIINPAAGKGNGKLVIKIVHDKMLSVNIPYSVSISGYIGEIEKIAKKAVEENYTDIIAVGGDGTLLETFNGIKHENVRLGVIPVGTGNDFSKMLNMSKNIGESVDIIIDGKSKMIDVGKANDTYFLNVAGMGIDSKIAEYAGRIKSKFKGNLAYLVATFTILSTYECEEFEIIIDDIKIKRTCYLVAIGNGKYFGGGMMVAPNAELDSDHFDIIIINKMPKFKFTLLFSQVFKGKHIEHKCVEVLNGENIQLKSSNKQFINADGNIIGNEYCKFEIMDFKQEIIYKQ